MNEKTCCTLLASTSCKNWHSLWNFFNHRTNQQSKCMKQAVADFPSQFKRKLAPELRKHTCYIASYLDYDEPLLSEERVFHNAEPVFKQHYQKQ